MPDLAWSAGIRNDKVSGIGPSQALLVAQGRLEQLRAARRGPRRASVAIFRPQESDHRSAPAGYPLSDLQPSAPVPPPQNSNPSGNNERAKNENPTDSKIQRSAIRLQPALALAILGAKQAPAGRIWLLLRFLDEAGQGWLPADRVREQLTGKKSRTHVCGRRQLRNLLNQGQGIFWERQPPKVGSRERIWLKSPARVAAALGLERLAGRPVEIPLAAMLGGIGQVRAHFYASFHSGSRAGDAYGAPISRTRLATLTQVPPRTQRLYDQAAGVKRQANYAVGADYNKENMQERAWHHGRAVFKFVDHQGKKGPAGRRYVAWRLPNSYAFASGGFAGAASSEDGKRNNKRPVDLVTSGAQGNDRSLKRCPRRPTTLFHPDGGAAGKAYNGDCSVDAYWPEAGDPARAVSHPVKIWLVIGRSASQRGGNLLPGL